VAIGIFVNSFVSFCSFVGAFFFSFLGLVLPGILSLKLLKNYGENENDGFFRKIKFILVLSAGLIIFVVSSISSFYALVTSTGISI
jgi:hypothetical protein